jgi:hypothetical protein
MFSMKKELTAICIFFSNFLMAQNYQAINGSSYAGSLGVHNNPASIVNVPHAWDITPFAIQFKQSTNAFTFKNYSYLSSAKNVTSTATNGTMKRFFYANQDIRLLNTRISLNSKAAIAFGANLRSVMSGTSEKSNWQDTMYTLADFMRANVNKIPRSGELSASMWAELYGSYAQTILNDGYSLLNAGVTFKVNRALAGAYTIMSGANYVPIPGGSAPSFNMTEGSLQYGYSSNIDDIDSSKSISENSKKFLEKTYASISGDIGIEYIKLADEDGFEGGDYAYDTKVGISILDIGSNKFQYGNKSSFAVAGLSNITDTLLEFKISNVKKLDAFNDSLSSVSKTFSAISGNFYIYQPTRLVINVDQHLIHNYFINAELSLPLISVVAKNVLYLKDFNLLAITPRWELKSVGAYLPLLLNSRGQFWIGTAFKAGPVLIGTHNIANIFGKNSTQSGGLYMAFNVRPGKLYDKLSHYPGSKPSKKENRKFDCPKF